MLLHALLLACAGSPTDAGAPGDTDDTDTDDTGPAAACTLVAPFSITEWLDLHEAHSQAMPQTNDAVEAFTVHALGNVEEGCPTLTETNSNGGRVQTIAGDCTTSTGWTYGGTVERVATSGETNAFTITFTDFTLSHPDGYSFFGDGTIVGEVAGESKTFDVDLTYEIDREGAYASGDDVDGRWTRRQTFHLDTDVQVLDGYVDVERLVDGTGDVGDFCVHIDIVWTDACDVEPDGVFEVQGTVAAVVPYDSATCDDCSPVTFDGEDAGVMCELD